MLPTIIDSVIPTYSAKTRAVHGGTQTLVKFPNGFGASIINHDHSYGIELAFVKFHPNSDHFNIINAEPFVDGIVGYIETEKELRGYLEQIRELPENYAPEEGERYVY